MSNRVTDIPGITHLWKYQNIYISGQPTELAWQPLKEKGVKKIVNLRCNTEQDFTEEQKKVESLGMEYKQYKLVVDQKMDPEAVKNISREVGGEDILIHCGSGNRVAGWLMVHLGKQGMDFEQVIEIAQEHGLSDPKLIEQAEDLVKS